MHGYLDVHLALSTWIHLATLVDEIALHAPRLTICMHTSYHACDSLRRVHL
jgi:hypothetical protein